MALRRAYTQPMAGGYADARQRKVIGVASLAITAGASGSGADLINGVAGNQVAAFVAPKDFIVTGITVTMPDMDTGTTVTTSIGDAASSTRFVNASTVGQSVGTISTLAATGLFYQFPADTEVLVTFTAGPTGAQAGNITNFYLEGFLGP